MGLTIELHGRAERDLQDIIDYRAREHGAPVAERVHDELLSAMRRLALRPFLLGRRTATPEVRMLSLLEVQPTDECPGRSGWASY